MIKNVFFDFNGTIIDDLKLSFSIQKNIKDLFNLKSMTLDEYLSNFKFPVIEFYEYLGLSRDRFQDVSYYFFDEYNKRMARETKVAKGVIKLFKKLKKSERKIYILSACEKELLYKQLMLFKLDKYFDGIACVEDKNALGKIEVGKKFIKENNIDTSSSCLIGDTVHDYEVAKTLNMKSILYTKGHNNFKTLKKCDDAIIIDSFNKINKYL